ncbi:hypothetical protein BDV95DRAFT_197365 [Massariosphaeria phaeospora]|uniref:Uncharacterized protein n=1 Tax=Massariosphaeria phaeospora TaxID=100035 RepID=A0A7C8HZY2_9PLEO|nr:hypothetical protein BDV95DRAFT_197365 [Massariosphaeria phaeospora]
MHMSNIHIHIHIHIHIPMHSQIPVHMHMNAHAHPSHPLRSTSLIFATHGPSAASHQNQIKNAAHLLSWPKPFSTSLSSTQSLHNWTSPLHLTSPPLTRAQTPPKSATPRHPPPADPLCPIALSPRGPAHQHTTTRPIPPYDSQKPPSAAGSARMHTQRLSQPQHRLFHNFNCSSLLAATGDWKETPANRGGRTARTHRAGKREVKWKGKWK